MPSIDNAIGDQAPNASPENLAQQSRSQQHAYLGMGSIGRGMAFRLGSEGRLEKPLTLWNRTHAKAAECEKKIPNSRAIESLQEAVVHADIVWLCLLNPDAVLSVFDQLAQFDLKGKLFVDCSTVYPRVTQKISEMLRAAGASLIAMPVMGSGGMAAKGQLTCLPAGDGKSIARIECFLLNVLCQATIIMRNEPPEKSSLMKMIGNIICLTTMQTVAECHVLAETTGLGTGLIEELLVTMFPRPPHTLYTRRMSTGDYVNAAAEVEIKKAQDVASEVLSIARQTGASLEGYKQAVARLDEAASLEGRDIDFSGMYGAIRIASGLPFSNQ